jgi:glucoamylase
VHGSSFFTISAQHRALVQGGLLAKELKEECLACDQASQILCFLENNFWNASGGYLTADVNVNNVNRSGINADPLLAAITHFDLNATCNASSMLPLDAPFFRDTTIILKAEMLM